MGAKGLNTRLRLIDAAVGLLETTTLAGLRVADIAAASGTSTAAFYKYFPDASAAVLAAVENCHQSTEALLLLASCDWQPSEAFSKAQAFVKLYTEVWQSNAAILRVRNLAAEEGDARFSAAREHAVRPLQDALAARFAKAQAQGQVPREIYPNAAAGAIIALLERMAAVSHVPSEQKAITHETLMQATAFILVRTLPSIE